jgi:hypothetical protein
VMQARTSKTTERGPAKNPVYPSPNPNMDFFSDGPLDVETGARLYPEGR